MALNIKSIKKVLNTAKKNGSITSSAKANAKSAQARSIEAARNSHVAKISSLNTKGYPTAASIKTQQAARKINNIINNAATTNARAAATANKVSADAQAAQMAYNAQQAAQANAINAASTKQQQQYNANQAAIANQITQESWEKTSAYNAAQQNSAMAYNTAEREAAQAYNEKMVQEERAWQEKMSATQYQRRMADLKAAGLNPILAYTAGGATVGGGAAIGTSAQSISPASVGSISGTAATSGLLSAASGNASSYTGQMENTSNQLALFGAVATSLSTAIEAIKDMNMTRDEMGEGVYDLFGDTILSRLLKGEPLFDNKKHAKDGSTHTGSGHAF